MGYGNTRTPSLHRRLGSATLSQLAFPGENNPNFLWKKSHLNNSFKKFFFLNVSSRSHTSSTFQICCVTSDYCALQAWHKHVPFFFRGINSCLTSLFKASKRSFLVLFCGVSFAKVPKRMYLARVGGECPPHGASLAGIRWVFSIGW